MIQGLTEGKASERANNKFAIHRGKHAGNSANAIKNGGDVCAVGGWDEGCAIEESPISCSISTVAHSMIRLYSTECLKFLGTLTYHKMACSAVSFARTQGDVQGKDATDDDEFTEEEKEQRSRWLVGGGQGGRISV